MLKWLALIFFAGCILTIYQMSIEQKTNQIDNLCRFYTANGKPQFIIVNGKKYNMTGEDKFQSLFIRDMDREQLSNLRNCIEIGK